MTIPLTINNDGTRVAMRTRHNNAGTVLTSDLPILPVAGIAPLVIFTQTATATVGNTGTETTLTGSGVGTLTLPANTLVAGRALRLKANGTFSTNALANPLVIRVKLGSTAVLLTVATAAATLLVDRMWSVSAIITCRTTGALGTVQSQSDSGFFHMETATAAATLLVDRMWSVSAIITCRTTGALGTVQSQSDSGFFHMETATAAGTPTVWEMTDLLAVVIDTTASLVVDLTADWTTAAALATINCTNLTLEILN